MIDKILDFNEYINENSIGNNSMLGVVNYSWIRKQINNVTRSEPTETTRLKILANRKNELNLKEFQTLFDYYNFCNSNSGQFKIANNPVENYTTAIRDWVWYLVILQLFPNQLKNSVRNFHDTQYKEILSLPELSSDLETNKIIFEKAVRNFFMRPDSITRQSLISYDTHFKNLF